MLTTIDAAGRIVIPKSLRTALGLVGVVQTGMGVAGVKAEVQVAVIGLLLIVSVLFSNITARKRGR